MCVCVYGMVEFLFLKAVHMRKQIQSEYQHQKQYVKCESRVTVVYARNFNFPCSLSPARSLSLSLTRSPSFARNYTRMCKSRAVDINTLQDRMKKNNIGDLLMLLFGEHVNRLCVCVCVRALATLRLMK